MLRRSRLQTADFDSADGRSLITSPDVVLVVLEDYRQKIIVLALGELGLVGNNVLSGTNGEQSVAARADEQIPVGVLKQAFHTRLQSFREFVSHETVALVVEPAQSFGTSNPKLMVAVDQQARDVVVLYGGAVVLIAEEIGETVAVEFVESVLSTHPDKAIVVLYDIVYHTARQLVCRIESSAVSSCLEHGEQAHQYQGDKSELSHRCYKNKGFLSIILRKVAFLFNFPRALSTMQIGALVTAAVDDDLLKDDGGVEWLDGQGVLTG